MSKYSKFLSIIVPVFNEQATVASLLTLVEDYLPPNSEIIVVNDGSKDATQTILHSFARPPFRLFNLPTNRGKGFALRYGFRQSRGQIFLIQDADLEYHPRFYRRLLKPITLGKSEVVFGSRLSRLPLNLTTLGTIPLPAHFIANKILSLLTSLLYHTQVTDMETCYKVFTRPVYQSLQLTKNGFDIEVELTAKILLSGFPILEVPITTTPRDYHQGKKITWVDGLFAVAALFYYRFFNPHRQPV